jgi:hypothetical protein
MEGKDVEAVQQLLGLVRTGHYNYDTASAVRGMQMIQRLPITGEVDEETATVLGPRAQDALYPEWFASVPIAPGNLLYDLLAESFGGEDGVRRTQGQYGIVPTGIIDEQTALIINTLGGTYGRA